MSESINIYVKTEKNLWEVKKYLELIFNCPFTQSPYTTVEIYSTQLLGLNISIRNDISYDDYEEISFSYYDFEIRFEYISGYFNRKYSNAWRQSIAFIVADIISTNLNSKCLIVKNMGVVIDSICCNDTLK